MNTVSIQVGAAGYASKGSERLACLGYRHPRVARRNERGVWLKLADCGEKDFVRPL